MQVVTPSNVTVGCGGAIVADSEPAAEWRETILKARAVADSLGARICGADDDACDDADEFESSSEIHREDNATMVRA